MRIGVDVGGTNTDAVLMSGRRVLAGVKQATTDDVTTGVVAALRDLLQHRDVTSDAVKVVVIGTTHFMNAFVGARDLTRTAVLRLGLPATSALPPLVDWPQRLRETVDGGTYLCHGGNEFDGREIGAVDEDEIADVAADIARRGTEAVAISSVFSFVDASTERRVARMLTSRLPHLRVSLSSDVGRIGLLERENATAINACLTGVAGRIADALGDALERMGIDAPLYLTQNNGTLMDVEYARRYPVATFVSGPTNSLRGAAFLSGHTDCIVVDVGGTTTDAGVLVDGYPQESSGEAVISGVRTNLRMPRLVSHGVGGGSIVTQDRDGAAVGPGSVAANLTKRSLVFGGDVLTLTDVAVAAGRLDLGDHEAVDWLGRKEAEEILSSVLDQVVPSVLQLRSSPALPPVVVVGGGSGLLGDQGATRLPFIRPPHFTIANAIGAAIAEPGGELERVFPTTPAGRDSVLDVARREARMRAIAAGALPGSVEIVHVDEAPIVYLPGNATWVRVRALGTLEPDAEVTG